MKPTRPMILVGCGKMGGALLSGWLKSGACDAGVHIVEPFGVPQFETDPRVSLYKDVAELPQGLDPECIIFAVKPQQMSNVVPAYATFSSSSTAFISIAAGTTIDFFETVLGSNSAIIRCMPNTPSAIGRGITVLCPNKEASEAQAALAVSLLEAVGDAVLVQDEALMDAVTAVSGSGPAYVFLMIEALAQAGVAAGLPEELSAKLALATVSGSGALAQSGDVPPAVLRQNVTSPGGTTFAALQILLEQQSGLGQLMEKAVGAATARSKELASS